VVKNRYGPPGRSVELDIHYPMDGERAVETHRWAWDGVGPLALHDPASADRSASTDPLPAASALPASALPATPALPAPALASVAAPAGQAVTSPAQAGRDHTRVRSRPRLVAV
jgi:hypothetical protein